MNSAAPREARRRILHVASGSLGLAWYLHLARDTLTVLLVALLVLAVALEVLRRRSPPLRSALDRLAGGALRPGEAQAVTGATLLAAGYAAAWLAFPATAAAPAILVTALADPAAALVGTRASRSYGRKTWAGSAAALLTAFGVLLAVRQDWRSALLAALAAALIERVAGRGLDNLAMPPVTAAALFAWR